MLTVGNVFNLAALQNNIGEDHFVLCCFSLWFLKVSIRAGLCTGDDLEPLYLCVMYAVRNAQVLMQYRQAV